MTARRQGISLKEHFNTKLHLAMELIDEKVNSSTRIFETKAEAANRAVEAAHASLDKRLDSMNEFRASLVNQNATFITKAEYVAKIERMEEDIRELNDSKNILAGKASQSAFLIAIILSMAAFVVSLINLVLKWRNP